MATTLFLQKTLATTHRGFNTPGLTGAARSWAVLDLLTTRGAGVVQSLNTSTVAGPTLGLEISLSGGSGEWLSPPVSADVTISGTITANIWASENNMSANVAINVIIDIVRANSFDANGSNEIVNIVKSTRTTEVAVTTNAVNNFTTGMTSGAYTGQTLNRGDRLRIRVFGDDAGTMASGFTFVIGYAGTTGAADGDTFVTFTEDITFETLGTPAGSTIYLRDTASDVSTGSVDREAWTTQGSTASVTDIRSLAAATGWSAPLQMTDTAGGTVVDWFTRGLTAFTLTGLAKANLRLLEDSVDTAASFRVEIARVDNDGTNATVWSSWCIDPSLCVTATTAEEGELDTTNRAETFWISGDALAISDGQRLRIRLYLNNRPNLQYDAGAHTNACTLGYDDGTGTAGDSFLVFAQTLTEFVSVAQTFEDAYYYQQAVKHASVW